MLSSYNFLLQATRVLQVDDYNEEDLEMIYNFTLAIDNEVLDRYNVTNSLLIYNSDLELYVEILDALIHGFVTLEDYEKCAVLKSKKDECIKIIKKKSQYE